MTMRRNLHRTAAAVIVAGAAVGATALASGTAGASSPQPNPDPTATCTPDQVSTELIGTDAGAGNRYGAIQFTANAGESCTLPGALTPNLVGAHNVLVHSDAAPDSPAVQLTDGASAHIPVHWSSVGGPDEQQTPLSLDVTLDPAAHADDAISLPWTLGPVDTLPVSHTIDTGATVLGPAQTS